MARRARRQSQEQELANINNQLEIDEPVAQPGPGNQLNMEDLIAALTAATRNNQDRRDRYKAPSYNGVGDVELFITQFQEIANTNNWTNQETLIHLRGKLKDEARDCGKGDDIDTLFQNLRTEFGLTQKNARINLDEIKKTKTQSFHEYGKAILKYLEVGYPNLGAEDRMDMAVDKFLRNSGDLELKRHLTTVRPTTIADAVAASDIFVGLGTEIKTRLSTISEEQNVLLDTLKLMQETLVELKQGKQDSGNRSCSNDLLQNMVPNQAHMTQQPIFMAPSYPGYHQLNPSFPHMGFPGYLENNPMMISQNQPMNYPKKSQVPRKLNCYQCGGSHLKRNCPQLQSENGNSQSATNNQQTLNSQGPTQ